ncbi:HNH endonuclease family protein [Lysinibacillus fusiformis]|uniref:HNH endonuclease family protein n=1 Tax=Lysinibacillus fusiformis TaxID=28031 RepID=UPI001CDA36FD|nr:HNH endonuclease family protein [Lysinibacillus fusiformis]
MRALENDRNTTTPGIRKYYSRNNFEQLYKSDVMGNLSTVLNLWLVVNNRVEIEDEEWSKNIEIKQVLDILTSYPNEFWKYPVVIYYLKYNDSEDFEELFLKFLKKLLAVLAARYIVTPTINAVKRGILNLNSEIIKSPVPAFDFSKVSEQELKDKIKHAHRNTVRMILKILAYQSQNDILPEKWEIEHILPQKWQTNYFPNNSESEVQELVEHIGNKVPFEKKLNIIAGNGYFKKKQQSYEKSKVQLVLNLSKNHNDWGLNEIRERDIRISDELLIILNDWGLNQPNTSTQDETSTVPTAEELKMIEELKRKGLI